MNALNPFGLSINTDGPMFPDVMIDLETLGERAGCAVFEVAAVSFDRHTGEQGREFYSVISLQSCLDAGLRTERGAIDFWNALPEQAQMARRAASSAEAPTLLQAATLFEGYLGKGKEMWGNGSDFDLPIWETACSAAGRPKAWDSRAGNCYRTLKKMFPSIALRREGTPHTAMSDARCQVDHLCRLLNKLRVLGVESL